MIGSFDRVQLRKKISINDTKLFGYIFMKFSNVSQVHLVIEKIKNLDKFFNFFLTSKIMPGFVFVNRNRLKNIFIKVIDDPCLWLEIEKMLKVGLIDFYVKNVYSSFDLQTFNSVNFLLFNVYLSELDIYMFNISYQVKLGNFFSDQKRFSSLISNKVSFFTPIKFSFFDLNNFNKNRNTNNYSFKFEKILKYFRYLDHIIVCLFSTKVFCLKLKAKLISFLKSNLFIYLKTIDLQSCFEKNISFLSYRILIRTNDKISSKNNTTIFRKESFVQKMKFTKLFLNRYYNEVVENFLRSSNTKVFSSYLKFSKKNFVNFFAFSIIQSFYTFRFWGLKSFGSSLNRVDSLSVFTSYAFFKFLFYSEVTIREIIKPYFFLKKDFKFSLDFFLVFLLSDFLKKYDFLVCLITDIKSFKKMRLRFYYTGKTSFVKEIFFNNIDLQCLKQKFELTGSFNLKKCLIYLTVPIERIFLKFRLFGFIHPCKNRSISNIKYIFLEDSLLISSFAMLSISLLNWFKLADNFNKLNLILSLIKKSCFLTLARKHKKSKAWSYRIYTNNVIFFNSLSLRLQYFSSCSFSLINMSNEFMFFDL